MTGTAFVVIGPPRDLSQSRQPAGKTSEARRVRTDRENNHYAPPARITSHGPAASRPLCSRPPPRPAPRRLPRRRAGGGAARGEREPGRNTGSERHPRSHHDEHDRHHPGLPGPRPLLRASSGPSPRPSDTAPTSARASRRPPASPRTSPRGSAPSSTPGTANGTRRPAASTRSASRARRGTTRSAPGRPTSGPRSTAARPTSSSTTTRPTPRIVRLWDAMHADFVRGLTLTGVPVRGGRGSVRERDPPRLLLPGPRRRPPGADGRDPPGLRRDCGGVLVRRRDRRRRPGLQRPRLRRPRAGPGRPETGPSLPPRLGGRGHAGGELDGGTARRGPRPGRAVRAQHGRVPRAPGGRVRAPAPGRDRERGGLRRLRERRERFPDDARPAPRLRRKGARHVQPGRGRDDPEQHPSSTGPPRTASGPSAWRRRPT